MEERKQLVKEIVEQMKAGYIITKDAWNSDILRPQNPISGVQYHGGNRLKLMNIGIQRKYTDPRWMTAIQIRDAGYRLRQDARRNGVMCEKWIFTRQVTVIDPDTGKKKKDEVELEHPRVSFFNVYNAADVEGLPEYYSPMPDETNKVANDFILSSECEIHEVAVDAAFYSPVKDEICIPPRQTFKSEEAFLSVLWHEMSHSTGSAARLNRPLKGLFGTTEYAKEELRAEIGSLFVASSLGMNISGENRQDYSNYLKLWIGVLEDDYNELFRACADAEKICNRLITNYEKVAGKSLVIQKVPTIEKPKLRNRR
jgi:antirestriction protein ArdC